MLNHTFVPSRNYPLNCWWVAGFSAEVTRKPLRRVLLNRAVVFYRCEDGTVVALEDRCVHRWAPLSEGTVAGDDLICPYHGFRYNQHGKCVHIPTEDKVPRRARVRNFPVREDAPFIWIWMGDPARAGDLPAPLPWVKRCDWLTLKGSLPVACNYMLIQENVLDLTHFAYLHANTFQQPGWDGPPSEVIIEAGHVGYRQVFDPIRLAPFQAIPTGLGSEKAVKRTDWGIFVSPAIHVAGIDIEDPSPESQCRSRYSSRIVHATTPESEVRSHYWWVFSQDYAIDDHALQAQVLEVIKATFAEDKHLLEIIQDTIDRDDRHDTATELSIGADRAGLHARRMLEAALQAESRNEASTR